MTARLIARPDGDAQKGAMESESQADKPKISNLRDSLADQLPHRNTNEFLEGEDSDFPEPGSSPEHSGQHK
ncbi:MAG TPA: hypothetical protein VE178_13115 [Silvibacterium sp.]|jgi:hypothetical protein|nr:hypothetical protein [Silvibacterium sp.]